MGKDRPEVAWEDAKQFLDGEKERVEEFERSGSLLFRRGRVSATLNRDFSIDLEIDGLVPSLGYRVRLRECSNSAQLLDWILQVNSKRWASEYPEVLSCMLDAMEWASNYALGGNLQGAFCPGGASLNVSWPEEAKRSAS